MKVYCLGCKDEKEFNAMNVFWDEAGQTRCSDCGGICINKD